MGECFLQEWEEWEEWAEWEEWEEWVEWVEGGEGGEWEEIHTFVFFMECLSLPMGGTFSPLQRPTPIVKTINITLHQAFTGYNCPLEIERWVQNNGRKHTEKEKIYVDIPPGIDTNEILVMRNKGNVINDNNKGDIKIFIKIETNPEFERNGLDLIYKKKISLKEALVGFKFEIKFINNRTYIINNNGVRIIKPGYEKIIPGMGMIRGENRGNFIVKFEIDFPSDLTQEQKKSLNEIL